MNGVILAKLMLPMLVLHLLMGDLPAVSGLTDSTGKIGRCMRHRGRG